MALINREQALSHPFANGQYDKEHADEHFIMGFEDYKEWLEDLPIVEAIPKDQYEARLKADMITILTDIKLKITEKSFYYIRIFGNPEDEKRVDLVELDDVNDIIQNKINTLEAQKDANE